MRVSRFSTIGRYTAISTLLVIVLSAHAQQKSITLDGKGSGRTFEGLGALSAGASTRLLVDYPEPQRCKFSTTFSSLAMAQPSST